MVILEKKKKKRKQETQLQITKDTTNRQEQLLKTSPNIG